MSAPAGWYDDGSGRRRWFDGQQWTDRYLDQHEPPPPPPPPRPGTAYDPKMDAVCSMTTSTASQMRSTGHGRRQLLARCYHRAIFRHRKSPAIPVITGFAGLLKWR